MHRGEGDRLVGARQDVPLVVGLGRRRELPRLGRRGDPRPHRPDHLPRGGRRRRPAAVGRRRSPTVGERPIERADHDHRLVARGRREGRLRALHAQGDPRAARGPRPVDHGPRRPGRPDRRRGARRAGRHAPGGRPGRARRLRQRVLRVARRRGGAPGLDRPPGPRDRRLGVPLQPAAARRADAGHRGHPVGRDGRHDRPGPPRARARLPGHRGHEHRRARRSPARPTRSCSCRPGRRSRWPPPRRSSPRSRPWSCSPRRSPGRAGRSTRRTSWPRRGAPRACPAAAARALEAASAGSRRRWPAATSTRAASCSSAAASTYPAALEGALKLKEVSYVHAEGYAAGELKHGPISLLDAECPLVAVATRSSVYDKLISNVMEGRARDARVIAVATEGDAQIERFADDVLLGARHARGARRRSSRSSRSSCSPTTWPSRAARTSTSRATWPSR